MSQNWWTKLWRWLRSSRIISQATGSCNLKEISGRFYCGLQSNLVIQLSRSMCTGGGWYCNHHQNHFVWNFHFFKLNNKNDYLVCTPPYPFQVDLLTEVICKNRCLVYKAFFKDAKGAMCRFAWKSKCYKFHVCPGCEVLPAKIWR